MISVCMATYNGERFIKQQIDSILCQLNSEDELIISDDGSTDGTLEIIASYNDDRIKLYHHQHPEYLNKIKTGKSFYYSTSNFENALKNAIGDYIFLSDQDDIWLPQKVVHCLSLLQENDCIVTNYQKIDSNGKIFQDFGFRKNPLHKSPLLNILDSHFRGCCMAFKADLLKIALPIPQNIIGHDYWLGVLARKYCKVYYELTPYIQSRWYTDSVSSPKKTSLYYKLSFRFTLWKEYLKRVNHINRLRGLNDRFN